MVIEGHFSRCWALNWMYFESKCPLGRLLGDRASFVSILKGFGVPVWSQFGGIWVHFCLLGGSGT